MAVNRRWAAWVSLHYAPAAEPVHSPGELQGVGVLLERDGAPAPERPDLDELRIDARSR